MKNHISIVVAVLILTSCEKNIDLTYKNNQSKIVIEGNISNEAGPYFVKITRSVKLTETGSYPVVNDAIVSISDNAGNSEILTPQGNGVYQCNTLTGIEGRTYTLEVQADGHAYTAQSTLPQRVSLDSVKVETLSFTGETEYNLIPVYRDPDTTGNNYRFMVAVNGTLVDQHLLQTDDVRNSQVNTQRLEINNDDLELKPGDQVSIQMQCVDKNVALFYKTLVLMGDSGPGGGSTPNNPPSNISNGALGLFSAHTLETKSVLIP
ncbi:MAG: DUF4249 domain-containing protein [Ferruginibacter sp.]